MGFFRNREVKRLAFFYLAGFGLIFLLYGMWQKSAALFLFISWAVAAAGALLFTFKRYQKIARLSQDIDEILHSNKQISWDSYNEGELAILQNEIGKMLNRLLEQSEGLIKEKKYLSDSIADISHQLRTPLTSMNLVLALMEQEEISRERRLKLCKELEGLISRMDWQIATLLKISKIDAKMAHFKKETVLWKHVIQKAYEPLAIPMELRGQKIQIQSDGTETFEGDIDWTTEAIGNILKNCMEQMTAGGVLQVKLSQNSIYSEALIKDNGKGIAQADLPHLFERFYKGENAGEHSVGIGLALANMIVQEQNGMIKADNHPEGGAVFTIRFYKSIV